MGLFVKCDNPTVKLCIMPRIKLSYGLLNDLAKKQTRLQLQGIEI